MNQLIKSGFVSCILVVLLFESMSAQTIRFLTGAGTVCQNTDITYSVTGTQNGKNLYENANVDIYWDGSQWVVELNGATTLYTNSVGTYADPPCFGINSWVIDPMGPCDAQVTATEGNCGPNISFSSSGGSCFGATTFEYNGTQNGKFRYQDPTDTYESFWDGSQWVIALVAGGNLFTNSANTVESAPCISDGTWVAVGGNACDGETLNGSVGDCGIWGLPVELLYFNAVVAERQVMLSWSTASEIDNEGFEIRYSTDGIDWIDIGFVQGNGNSNEILHYNFNHQPVSEDVAYYSLKQIDYDGQFEIFPAIAVDLNPTNTNLSPYPNPVLDNYFYVNKKRGTVRVFNMAGNLQKVIDIANFGEKIDISSLSYGQYILEYFDSLTGSYEQSKLSKLN